ncbi:virulence protein PagD [Salmonella enterica subsp. houtenae]|nr:virulence protein PagD [Salmonella enterica subsp. houtenae]
MKHHAFMLWSLIIFSFPALASSCRSPGLQQTSWEIFIYDFGSKTPQPPASTDKKQARKNLLIILFYYKTPNVRANKRV